jgi:hypothetical protein
MRVLLFLTIFFSSNLSHSYPIDYSIGFGLGHAWTQAVFNDPIRQLDPLTTETPSYSDVKSGSKPFNLYANLRFHKHYGIELGYISYGSIEFNKSLITADDNSIIESRLREAHIAIAGLYINHVIYLPISDRFIVQAKAGLVVGNSEYSDIETLTIEPQDSGSSQQVTQTFTSDSEALTEIQMAAALFYRSTDKTAWRLQVSQLAVSHDGENEKFTQWFTQVSYEIKL